MGERLELSWERIRKIPEEVNRDTLHGAFFASLSVFFLQFLKGREEENFNKESLRGVLAECLQNCPDYLFPQDALQKKEEGDILSVLLYLSLGLVYERKRKKRFAVYWNFLLNCICSCKIPRFRTDRS